MVTSSWIAALPKVELHVHLEGTIRPETMLALYRRHGLSGSFQTLDELRHWFRFRDFKHFIDIFTTASACMQAPEDFYLVVREYGEELIAQNVMYAELHFNPEPHWRKRGLDPRAILAEMNRAREELRERSGLELRWIADGVRDADSGPASVSQTVDWMIEFGHEAGIVALGLGGDETNGRHVTAFADAFQRARDAGFHTIAHAGEVSGPEHVRETLDVLKAERIGHGLGAAKDPDVMAMLVERGVPVELCPTSNVCTGAVDSVAEVPFQTFQEHGVGISISSDDPPMFNTTLTNDLEITASTFQLSRADVIGLIDSAISHSFAEPELKDRMRERLRAFALETQAEASASTSAR